MIAHVNTRPGPPRRRLTAGLCQHAAMLGWWAAAAPGRHQPGASRLAKAAGHPPRMGHTRRAMLSFGPVRGGTLVLLHP